MPNLYPDTTPRAGDDDTVLLGKQLQLLAAGITTTLTTGDIEIGAVELKNSDTDARANILPANTARTTGTIVLATQSIDAAGAVLSTSALATSAKQPAVTPSLNTGVMDAGTQRVTLATDGPGVSALATIATNTGAATPAGANIIGKVGIDQTVDGTTNLVAAKQSGTSYIVSGLAAVGAAPTLNPLSISGLDGGGLKRHVLTNTAGNLDVVSTQMHADLVAATPAGTNLMGKVGIDQTTPGYTNLVAIVNGSPGVAAGLGSSVTSGALTLRVVTSTDSPEVTTLGGTTDAAVAAGAAGSLLAQTRRLTTDLDALKTATHNDLIAATPAGANIIGKVGIDQTVDGTTNLVAAKQSGTSYIVSGLAAVGATPTLNPLSISGVDGGGLKRHVLTNTAGNLDVVSTQMHADLIAATPTGANIIGQVTTDLTTPGTTNRVAAVGAQAVAATLSTNPVVIAGVNSVGAIKTILTDSTGVVSVGADNDNRSDGISNNAVNGVVGASFKAGFQMFPWVFNGATWDRARNPNIFKTVSATASGNTSLWAGTSAKKHRIMRLLVQVSADAATAGGADVVVDIQDVTATTNLTFTVFIPAVAATALGPGWTSGWIDIGNGLLCAATNTAVNVNLSAALTSGVVRVMIAGTDE